MHKGIILLTKAKDRKEAIQNTHDFLETYENEIFDFYSIGNRFNNKLAPQDKNEKFIDWMKENYPKCFEDTGYPIDYVENEKDKPIIQAKWKEIGLKGINPFYDAYGFSLPDSGPDSDDYNVVLLKDCIETVRKWCRDIEKEAEEAWVNAEKARKEEKERGYWSGYYALKYNNLFNNTFNFDTCVYNITIDEAETIPNNIENYWAVMVDMHN